MSTDHHLPLRGVERQRPGSDLVEQFRRLLCDALRLADGARAGADDLGRCGGSSTLPGAVGRTCVQICTQVRSLSLALPRLDFLRGERVERHHRALADADPERTDR
jgi:hypothetical protein